MSVDIETHQLQTYGFTDLQLKLILRGSSDTLKEKLVGNAFTLPNHLSNFSPLGNPPPFFVGYATSEQSTYFTQFIANDAAIELLAKGTPTKNPIYIVDALTESMKTALTDNNTVITAVPHYPEDVTILQKLRELDTLLYNLVIGGKIIFVGETQYALKLLQNLITLLPESLQVKCSFAVNIPNPHIQFIVIDPQVYEHAQETIDDLVSKGYDIVDLIDNQAYGNFTTDLTVKLADEITTGTSLQSVQNTVQEIFDVALSATEITSDLKISERKITLADTDFLLQIRQEMQT